MGTKTFQQSIGIKKEAMINALQANLGNITKAARQAGITPPTHYRWIQEDLEYNRRVFTMKNVNNGMIKDTLLSAALKKIEEGDSAVLNQLLRIYLKKLPEEIDRISKTLTPSPVKMLIKVAPHPRDLYAKDKMTQLAVKEYIEESKKEGRDEIDPALLAKAGLTQPVK